MSTPTTPEPLTARTFLLGHAAEDSAEVLARALREQEVARAALGGCRLSAPALRAVDGEIAAVAARLLDLPLGDALVSAWRTYGALVSAAERTFAVPGSEEVVVLATHRVTWSCDPHLDLLVDGVRVTTLDFELAVTFDLEGVVAVVQLGNLVALRAGECTITASLTLQGATLAHRQGRTHPAIVLPLDPPVPLLGDAAPPGHGDRGSARAARPVGATETA
jgi:hypothetical protein